MARVALKYEIIGSAEAEGKGYWRWAIFAAKSNRPLQVGTCYGSLPDAKKHAEAAVVRLKGRLKVHRRRFVNAP